MFGKKFQYLNERIEELARRQQQMLSQMLMLEEKVTTYERHFEEIANNAREIERDVEKIIENIQRQRNGD